MKINCSLIFLTILNRIDDQEFKTLIKRAKTNFENVLEKKNKDINEEIDKNVKEKSLHTMQLNLKIHQLMGMVNIKEIEKNESEKTLENLCREVNKMIEERLKKCM